MNAIPIEGSAIGGIPTEGIATEGIAMIGITAWSSIELSRT